MPIIRGELGDLTAEEAEAREQGIKSVKEQLAEESPTVRTIVLQMVPGSHTGESKPDAARKTPGGRRRRPGARRG